MHPSVTIDVAHTQQSDRVSRAVRRTATRKYAHEHPELGISSSARHGLADGLRRWAERLDGQRRRTTPAGYRGRNLRHLPVR